MPFPGETATISVPDKKFRSTCRLCINYQANIENLRSAQPILRIRNCLSRIPRKSPLTQIIERPRRLSFVAEIQVASPIAVKSLSLSAMSLTATTLRHLTFAFLASVRLETICVHPYESTLPSPTNHVNVLTLFFSFSPSLTCSLCRTAELNGKKRCDRRRRYA